MADNTPEMRDPIVHGSLNWHITIATVLLALSLVWMFYDETVTKRPWKGIQADFQQRYTKLLEGMKTDREQVEVVIEKNDDLKALSDQIEAAIAQAKPEIEKVDVRLSQVVGPRITKLQKKLQELRSEVMATTYILQHKEGAEREALEQKLEKIKTRKVEIEGVVAMNGDGVENMTVDYYELTPMVTAAKEEKSELLRRRAALDAPRRLLTTQYDDEAARIRKGLSPEQIGGLLQKMENFDVDIKQIHVDEYGLVERCETCHLGIREPVELTKENIGEEAFVSHPHRELLQIHDPEKFGCTPCHNGNGSATISAKEGHGKIKHWLYPMYDMENVEAGCLQCHDSDLVLAGAETLNAGKEIFRFRGCWGCHPREGFDVERAEVRQTDLAVQAIRDTIDRVRWEYEEKEYIADNSEVEAEYEAALAALPALTQKMSILESELIELERKYVSLKKQAKNPGPNLRPIKSKLNKDWLKSWIKNPREFRPTTRMPVFRLTDTQVEAIASAVWQAADPPNGDTFEAGDAARGKELFESRGCQACHAAEKNADGEWFGNIWGPELSRVGEKANYDYIVGWIHDTPDWSVMPNLRLTVEDSQDIATYLMGLSGDGSQFEHDTAYLDDAELAEYGGELIRHFGCAGCHDIAGFENAGKIGTELTVEGNKPIERLDFGLYTQAAKRGWDPETGEHVEKWYDHKSFFIKKLEQPEFFDHGKLFESELEKARMPNFGLSEEEVTQVVTFMLGSVDSGLPEAMYYDPEDPGKRAIRDGWWIIKKYNCMGCHQVLPGQVPAIQHLPQYQGEREVLAPPSLVGVGARLNPEWLAAFLRNPAMNDHHVNINGVRSYLQIRMPTFNLWDEEIGALVAFFEALSDQRSPYFPPHYPAMSADELALARNAFLDADCLNCHASAEGSESDPSVIAPSFVHGEERLKPLWTERWIVDPAKLMPGTKMPAGLFKKDPDNNDRWIVAGQMSDALKAYMGDHVDLFVRYITMIDENEAEILREVYEARKPPPGERDDSEEVFEEGNGNEEEEFFDE